MNIQRLYEATYRYPDNVIGSFMYKINKGIVNLFYPIFEKGRYGLDDSHNVIISLTTYPARIDTVYITIMTLLNQTYKPKMIVLWLAEDQFTGGKSSLPQKLIELEKFGLTIRFCDNLYSHKKYYYTMLENPESVVVTVDDDVFYPENLLELLVETSKNNPGCIACTLAHRLTLDDGGDVFSFEKWENDNSRNTPSYSIMPTGIGGVLYPPHCLSEELFNKESMMDNCLRTDDYWLKAMALLKETKAVRVNRPSKIYFSILKTQSTGLYYSNVVTGGESWNKLMKSYPKCRELLRKALQS